MEHCWSGENGSWTCSSCGGAEFYDVHRPTKRQLDHGTWMYIPLVRLNTMETLLHQDHREGRGDGSERLPEVDHQSTW